MLCELGKMRPSQIFGVKFLSEDSDGSVEGGKWMIGAGVGERSR